MTVDERIAELTTRLVSLTEELAKVREAATAHHKALCAENDTLRAERDQFSTDWDVLAADFRASERALAECKRMIAMDTVTVNSQVAMLDELRKELATAKNALLGSSIVVAEVKERARTELAECMEARRTLLVATDEMRAEENSAYELIQRQGKLLTGVVNALKGAPPEDTLWSHHDAPELAAALVALVLKGLAVVEDFMPSIGGVALQDYARLNEFLIEATKLKPKEPQT